MSCRSSGENNEVLEYIDSMCFVHPQKAIQLLDSMNVCELSESDKHYYDLLTIKANDKAYVVHKSDSLIRDVVDYYSSYGDQSLYPISLYYAGRVYSDLGDYPTALRYFQNVLQIIPEKKENLSFIAPVISQTARVLDRLRLYSQALPYLQKSIEIGELLNDTLQMAYGNDLMCKVQLHIGNLDAARRYNSEAIKFMSSLSSVSRSDMKIDLASILYREGKNDSALQIIRNLPDEVDSLCRNYALIVAARIYLKAGIADTAYMYAHELAMSNDPNNRNAFKLIFSSDFSQYVPKDTLLSFIPLYKKAVENYLNNSEVEAAAIQNSYYNYQMHLHEKESAVRVRNRLFIILLIVSLIAISAIAVVVCLRLKNLQQIVRLQRALALIKALQQSSTEQNKFITDSSVKSETTVLREKILKEFEVLERDRKQIFSVRQNLIQSDIYNRLSLMIQERKALKYDDPLWHDLRRVIENDAPGFKGRLDTLTNCHLSNSDFQIALLMRFGISPTNMAVLLNRTKSTITSRRSTLCNKIFGSKVNIKLLDALILYI